MNIIFWLILVSGSGAQPVHVGNYGSLADCEKAAKADVFITRGANAGPYHGYICVQANDATHGPPP
jgi:hypothetical protein